MSFSFLEFFTRANFTDVHRYITVDAARALEKTQPTNKIFKQEAFISVLAFPVYPEVFTCL